MSPMGMVLIAVLLAVGCSDGASTGAPPDEPGRARHDDTVAALEDRVEREHGWLVVRTPLLHEGGGHTRWWLAPCDITLDATRDATRTGFSGSDVADVPGAWFVERDEVACTPTSHRLESTGAVLDLDVELYDLGAGWLVLDDVDTIAVTDAGADATFELSRSGRSSVSGTCDGRNFWTISWHERIQTTVERCVDRAAALPAEVRELLGVDGDELASAQVAVAPEQETALAEAMDRSGWTLERLAVSTFEGRASTPMWRGPCAEHPHEVLGARGRPAGWTRPEADLYAGWLSITERPCDPPPGPGR